MKNGYRIFWTSHALLELEATIAYLQEYWSERELKKFSRELEHTIELISRNPTLFPNSQLKQDVRRAVVARYNSLYYRTKKDTVEIISFFSNRQDPDKMKL